MHKKKAYANYSEKACRMVKSSHKLRKTYISSLIDGVVNLYRVIEIVGHGDEKTTLNSYCYDRLSMDENINLIENALRNTKSAENEVELREKSHLGDEKSQNKSP